MTRTESKGSAKAAKGGANDESEHSKRDFTEFVRSSSPEPSETGGRQAAYQVPEIAALRSAAVESGASVNDIYAVFVLAVSSVVGSALIAA